MEETKIPVFSVLKKGATLKNIFLNSPLSPSAENDPILIGRHPDCDIVVDHPSISRFHLEVRPKKAIQKLFITDRSSVHGTWVSGQKVLPDLPIELIEGDTVRLGASTRIYRLHWMPLSHAFEMEKPMSPVLEEEVPQDENLNDPCFSYVIPSAPPMPEIMKAGKHFSLDFERDGQSLIRKVIEEESSCFFSIAPLLESVSSSLPMEESGSSENFFANEMKPEREEQSAPSPLTSDKKAQSSSLLSRRNKTVSFLEIENRNSVQREVEIEEHGTAAFERGYGEEKILAVLLDHRVDEEDMEEESFVSDKENMTPLNSIFSKAPKSNREIKRSPLSALRVFNLEEGPSNSDNENQTPEALRYAETDEHKSGSRLMREKEEFKLTDAYDLDRLSSSVELQRSLFKQERSSLFDNKILNAQESSSNSHKNIETSESSLHLKSNNPKSGGGWMKGKEESKYLQRSLLTPEQSPLRENKALNVKEDMFHSDEENWTPEVPNSLKAEKKAFARDLLKVETEEDESKGSDANDLEQQFFSGVKLQRSLFRPERSPLCENIVLNVKEDRFLSDKEKTPEVTKSLKAEKAFARDDESFVSDKENLTPQTSKSKKSKKLLTESHSKGKTMKRRKERIPFQPLFESSPLKTNSPPHHVQVQNDYGCSIYANNGHNKSEEKTSDNKHMDELPHMPVREKKKWYLIVDVGCFLNEESRKSLQLLEGIKGTQLIIPRIVIRELDHLKRSEGLFSRGTKASSVLQWIEKCMMKTSWWIHIQSSSETLPVPPTPPATPRSQLCDGTTELCATSSNFTGFSTCGSLMEIVSPTAEDHILDCALLFRRIKGDDGQLMLLSSSTTLRIKAMAEGLRCETPKEFRESLVNPFSKRFLWTDSSPRGSTWSCLEEVGPSDNCFQQFPAVRTPKASGTVKGLKLLLLHNSHYGTAINSVY